MIYATLKALHLLAAVVWVGGMFFMLACLRPAAAVLEPAPRVRLMHATLRRFFAAVTVSATLAFLTGATMIAIAWSTSSRAGLAFNMPLDWYVMVVVFFLMLVVFLHVRLVLFRRLHDAVRNEAWPDGAAALRAIRWEVTANFVLGVFIVFVVRLGGTA